MKMNFDELLNYLSENSGNYAVRGLSGICNEKEYEVGEALHCSLDNWEGREVEYVEELPLLSGTCGFVVDYYNDDEFNRKMVEKAKNYSDNGRVILIKGDFNLDEAYDEYEVVVENAKYVAEII